MRLKTNSKEVASELRDYSRRVLEQMELLVVKTATNIASIASDKTPIGDSASLNPETGNASYRSFYIARNKEYGLPVDVGYHRGAWQYSESPNFTFLPLINSADSVVQNVGADAYTSYHLGDTFYIGAVGPAYDILNSGANRQAPDGILQPTLDEVIELHKINVQALFGG